jgi:diguanylate cyclase (GGDEF)-like protein/PAS domain S-box-containing protein
MGPRGLFVAQVALYAAFPFAFSFFARPLRLVLFYVYLAMVLVVGGFLGSVYVMPLSDSVTVSAGSVLYGALILTSLMLVIGGRDARVVRNIIKIVIVVNVFKVILFGLTVSALQDPDVVNRFSTSPEVFRVSLMVVATGGVLIVTELVLLLLVFERIKRRVSGLRLALLSVTFYLGVLLLDDLLFPLLNMPGSDELGSAIAAGVRAKLVLGLAYSVPLLLFLAVFRHSLDEYRAVPMRVSELFFAPEADLVEEIGRQQEAIEVGADRYRSLIDSTGDAVVGTTLDGEVISWNPAAAALYGYSEEHAVGRHVDELLTSERGHYTDLTPSLSSGRTVSDLQIPVDRPDGSRVDVALTLSPVRQGDGAVVGISSIGRDVTERNRLQHALEHQALHDGLTGLPNRALLVDRLSHALQLSSRSRTQVAVLFLDLDHFKMVNDARGHHTGDRLLVAVAERLRSTVRAADTVARLGGDEFVVLCEATGEVEATIAASQILASLAEPFTLDGARFYVTSSIGIAVAPPGDAELLLRQADAAMYDAKSRGRGRAQLFDSLMATRTEGQLSLAGDLREALAAGELRLHYQPVVELTSGRVVAVEALARWRHPVRGDVAPAVFIPLAEQTGAITALDTWAMTRACRDGAGALASGLLPPDGHVAVNLSARDVNEPEVERRVQAAVEAAGPGFSYERLVLEGHGDGRHGGPRALRSGPREAARPRRDHRHRRLRHRLLLAGLPPPLPRRPGEDRPELRARHRGEP